MDDRQHAEGAHFDDLVGKTGETWWGSATPAGVERLRYRARLTLACLAPMQDPLVVELGCGTGAFSAKLLEGRPDLRLEGVDISERAVAAAGQRLREYPNAVFRKGDASRLPHDSDSVDAIAGVSILHHLPGLPDVFAEMHRVLRPGGMLWFSEPNMMNPQVLMEKNVRPIGRLLQNTADETAFFRGRLARLARDAGFAEVQVAPFDFVHPLVPRPGIGAARMLSRIAERVPLVREIAGSLCLRATK